MVKRIVSTLLTALAVLALLSPQALAAGTEKGLDQVLVSADGTVTLVSGHAADEKVSSVQLQLEVEPLEEGQLNLSFTFGSLPQDILSSCSTGANTVSIYVVGTEALIPEGQTQLVLGTLSVTGANGPAMARVSLAELSLKYVYGTKLVPQAAAGTSYLNISSGKLQSLVETAKEAAAQEEYTEESRNALKSAWEDAEEVLKDSSASAEELAAACNALYAAMNSLQSKLEGEPSQETRDSLKEAIDEAEALREENYSSGFDVLTEALEAAKAVQNDPTKNEGDLQAAIAALAAARENLVEKPAPTPGNPGSVPEGKPGAGESGTTPSPSPIPKPSTKPSPSPSPNLPTRPSPSPSTSPSPSVSPSPAVSGSPDAEAEAESGALPTAMPRPSAPAGAVHRTDADSSFVPWALALAACAVLAVLALFLWRRYRR